MPARDFDIGIVTDEISRDLGQALDVCRSWGIRRFELREGSAARFPGLTPDEIQRAENEIRLGGRVTAVSPGLFKGRVDDKDRLDYELNHVLPRALDMAGRFESPLLIVFGFERYDGEPEADRKAVLRALEQAAVVAEAVGMQVAIENEPSFWIDRPAASAQMLGEIGHPALKLNWDPANSHWGGRAPAYADFRTIRPYLANLHVKDFYPDDPQMPWRPVGQGRTPWRRILTWILSETDLPHATLETHCLPPIDSSRQSLEALRACIASLEEQTHG
ncbi:MAG TPA: sugar phosphate isomerase/epimerase family protein [Rhodothermales bacterium]|nr:sugar phosphate isomerase/epimerase family protein [Rhodothermales bacterium]